MAKKTKRKRLVLGRDFDGWAWEYLDGTYSSFAGCEMRRLKPGRCECNGKWVRVKFTKVGP